MVQVQRKARRAPPLATRLVPGMPPASLRPDAVSESVPVAESAHFGHPKGLFFLAFAEAWERFSYYGMTALLALYVVN